MEIYRRGTHLIWNPEWDDDELGRRSYVKVEVLRLYREKYLGFNLRQFHEELRQEIYMQPSYAWVKQVLLEAGLVEEGSEIPAPRAA